MALRVRLDHEGRLLIPKPIRDMLGMTQDSFLVMDISPGKDAICIYKKRRKKA